jgi:hypothetical protein
MADRLSWDLALKYARGLKRIKDFPWDKDVITATAEDLVKWCTGATIDGRYWCPEAQADWLTDEAAYTWEKWEGTAALRELFRRKFVPPVAPGDAAVDYGPPQPIQCKKCNDTGTIDTPSGHQYCDCSMGSLLEASPEVGDRFLLTLDRCSPNRTRLPKPERRDDEPMPAGEDLARHRDEQRRFVEQAVEDARAMAKDPAATKEQRKSARKLLKRYAPPGKRNAVRPPT